ncbi:hypothetical protein BS47DRAFT_1337302, partial [Hydnum rufescens UP504]
MAPQATFVPFMDLSSSKPPHFSNNAARMEFWHQSLYRRKHYLWRRSSVYSPSL